MSKVMGVAVIAVISLVIALVPGAPQRPFFGVALQGYPITSRQLSEVQSSLGGDPRLINFFLQWDAPPGDSFNREALKESLRTIWEIGAVPVVTWEPAYFSSEGTLDTVTLEQIKEGTYDRYLNDFGQALAEWGNPVLIRFAHEMNLSQYHWSGSLEEYDASAPGRYQEMYRLVVERVKAVGARNALWVFCPNNDSVPGHSEAPWNRVAGYYPGSKYVDIFGMDGYNWGRTATWSTWRPFKDLFTSLRQELREIATDKPIIVFETSSVGDDQEKREWLDQALHVGEEWGLVGLSWFHANKERDWRLPPGWKLEGSTGDAQLYFSDLIER